MLQAYGSNENVVALVPSMMRSKSTIVSSDGERGRVLLFTGVQRERMEIAPVDRIALSHAPEIGSEDLSHG